MVSPLSSRIMNAEAKANINGRSKYRPLTANNVIGEWQIRGRKRVSGYTADRSESPPASLYCIDKEIGPKEMRARQVENLAKRRKTEEANFQAFNVKHDLAKAGVQSLPGLRSRALPRGSVNMDNVTLVCVSKESPYPVDEFVDDEDDTKRTCQPQLQHGVEEYLELLKQAQHFYTSKEYIPTRSEEAAANSRSSTVSSGGTTDNPSDSDSIFAYEIPTKLIDVINSEDKSDADIHYGYITKSMNHSTDTLENALVSCDSARLIVDNTKSLTVIHGNAAFSQLTGIASDNLFGKQIRNIFDSSSMTKTDSKPAILTLRSKDKNSADEDSSSSFAFTVSPIKNNGRVTHFVITFSRSSSFPTEMAIDTDSIPTLLGNIHPEKTILGSQHTTLALNAIG